MQLAKDIYVVTKKFPKSEQYGLTSQLRMAAVSVPTNTAEGAARKGDREFIQFLYISLGSLSKLETLILLSVEFLYITESESKKLLESITTCSKLVYGLIKSLKNKQNKNI